MACNFRSSNVNGIIFPDFVRNSCCNPCCEEEESVGGVNTGCCCHHCGSVGGVNSGCCNCGSVGGVNSGCCSCGSVGGINTNRCCHHCCRRCDED